MSGIRPGCVVHWKDYKFSDGEAADKYLVIVGCKQGANYLAVLGTSKPHKRSFTAGCHHEAGYYHCPAKLAWFPLDTWLLLADPVELEPGEFLRLAMTEKVLSISGQIQEQVANAIRNCLKLCPDVSASHIALL